ncbi:uncharacterized protein B0I36DRAFT_76129 [Microdochium trichocladiopsis]|uniref:EthD domain-containing protein n=1 Tax=Microdochium trichocladiopsis TaxID=1682393 RepID=A0A9P8YHP9_9PEZI|nr:uncharacterized protein B0I36DRAFT_76129 [Microdochium trichocladiopsis]KAH7038154.1 hypothetical protein B0I36DRAFT_76129 [Microdochium trichocladiopsis]
MSVDKSGPGLCLIAAKITEPHLLSARQLSKWYEECHIPRLMATGGFSSMLRGAAADLDNGAYPFVSIYAMPDISFANSQAFKLNIGPDHPVDHELYPLPDGAKISDVVEIDFRIYRRITDCHAGGRVSNEIKAFALVEGDARDSSRSEAVSKVEFEQGFVPFIKTIPSAVHWERYVLEMEWWSAGGCLYNRDALDFYGFAEEEPDYAGNFEKLMAHPGAPRLEDFNFEIKTYRTMYTQQADHVK